MSPKSSIPGKKSEANELRSQAEEKWIENNKKTGPLPDMETDIRRLVHELEVHQIELEMQNEELMQARAEVEAALDQYTDLYDFAPVGYFSLTRDGRILKTNLAGADLLGVERKQLMDRHFGLFVSALSQPVFRDFLENGLKSQESTNCEVALLKPEQESLWVSIDAIWSEKKQEFHAVVRDIGMRKRTEDLIRQHTAELEHRVQERTVELTLANRAKGEFLATISHELRTPLNSILGFSETLLEQSRGPLNEKQEQYLGVIHSSGQHLLGLINNILEVSTIEAGKLEVHPELISVREVCETSLNLVRKTAVEKSIAVEFKNEQSIPTLFADPLRLKQILINLLNNAIKFTPPGGRVLLEVQTNMDKDQIHFSVIDTGIGIAQENLTKLFTPFTQLDSSLSRQYEGSGLGLVLVLKLTALHGGSVDVESEPGTGSRFTVKIPWNSQLLENEEIGLQK